MNTHASPKKYFGQVLRQLRREKNLTQESLAERIGTSTAFVGFLEVGKKHPSLDMLFRVADALATPPAELVEAIDKQRHGNIG